MRLRRGHIMSNRRNHIYTISCHGQNGNSAHKCFYIGKSQRYTKTRVRQHIGEVKKSYDELVLSCNCTTHLLPNIPNSQDSLRLSDSSLAMQESTEPLESSQPPPMMCVVIKPPPSPSSQGAQQPACTQPNQQEVLPATPKSP
jgi:hypothetical protein